jgi:hypothetical protein
MKVYGQWADESRAYSDGGRIEVRNCIEDGCDKPVHGRGRCKRHYAAWRRNERADGPRCVLDGCDRPAIGKGLCMTHYTYQRLYGRPQRTRPRFDRDAQRLVLAHLRSGMSLREAAIAAGWNPESVKSMTTQGRSGQTKSTIAFAQQVDAILTARAKPKRTSNGLSPAGSAFLAELDLEVERDLRRSPGRQQWISSLNNDNNRKRSSLSR